MHSSDAARRHSRRRPELNINTVAPIPGRSRDTVPQTPPARSKPPVSCKPTAGGRALRVPSSTSTSTARDAPDIDRFLDSVESIDMSNKENDRPEPGHPPNPRDSHDLSLPPRQVTRDSLVANMLLSLDQLSMGQLNSPFGGQGTSFDRMGYDPGVFSSFGGDDSRTMTFNSRSGRSNGQGGSVYGDSAIGSNGPGHNVNGSNGHGYSYSSDFEGNDDSSRISSPRGRRSNSSSGFHSSLSRINSRTQHSRSAKGPGSKSSSSNSIDAGYAQVLGSQRWAQGFARSSSFDLGPARTATSSTAKMTQQQQQQQQSPWHIEFSNTFFSDEYEAAPTPTIPGGPRRLAAAPSLPVLQPPPPPPEPSLDPKPPGTAPNMERRRSTRSSRSATVGRKSGSYVPRGDAPVIPVPTVFDLDSAPAPHVGYEKTKEPVPSASTPASQPLPVAMEKPGFFRRMFGGSSKSSPAPTVNSPSGSSVDTASASRSHIASQMKSLSSPPSRDSHHSATHTLQKKTSSFFRRRKQSFGENELPPIPAPPVPSLQPMSPIAPDSRVSIPPELMPPFASHLQSSRPEPSPITSLRRAMDPFLQGSPATPNIPSPLGSSGPSVPTSRMNSREQLTGSDGISTPVIHEPQHREESHDRHVRSFSPDYDPSPKAVIRKVDPEPPARDEYDSRSVRPEDFPRVNTPTRDASTGPVSAQGSFLADNSDSEASPQRNTLKPSVPEPPARSPARTAGRSPARSPVRSPSPNVAKAKSSPNLRVSRASSTFLALPIEGIRADDTGTVQAETSSNTADSVPSLKVDIADSPTNNQESANHSSNTLDEPLVILGEPREDDRQKAQNIYDGKEDFIQKEKAAAWMGEEGPVRQRTLRAYMDLFDFKNRSIVSSLRQVCNRLILRAETQQIDRILVAFARRWCDCNPNHGFKAMDTIHTICYSIMLLNTDLHMAEVDSKMTRSQFVKNTMSTIRQSLQESNPEVFERASILPGRSGLTADGAQRPSMEGRRNSFRASFKPPPRSDSALGDANDQAAGDDCGPLVKAPFDGNIRAWESQVELVLKEIYASIRDERLPLFGAEAAPAPAPSGLTVMNMLKRTPSVLSKTPSETMSTRGRIAENVKSATGRWSSKSRSRPRALGGTAMSSSRTSFEDNNSLWSPTESSATWSRYSLGRTHTTMSMDSFSSAYPYGDYQQSIGFANALSHAIIKEDNDLAAPSVLSDELKTTALLEDESLELAGPPWVKEGIVTHKHHLDGLDKKAKDRNWTEVFAVVQKGQLNMFSFTPNKTLRNKSRSRGNLRKGAVVGGGNWQENATNLGVFSLRQALASALPPPGYSRSRPYVWALSLPSGAVHLFQVGTPEICKEFVNTANYWAARLSTHPLIGGISNIEYGWSDAIINNPIVTAINESQTNLNGRPATGASSTKGHSRANSAANAATMMNGGRSSMQSRGSLRSSSLDHGRPGSSGSSALAGGMTLSRHGGGKLPGDLVHIAEWTPPTQSMRPSNLGEREQLDTLTAYVRNIEEELQQHNALRSPMLLAFAPRGHNAARAMANWQRKSEYLLREIVKFRTYTDSLQQADGRKAEIYRERELARRAALGEEVGSLISNAESDGVAEAEGDETMRP